MAPAHAGREHGTCRHWSLLGLGPTAQHVPQLVQMDFPICHRLASRSSQLSGAWKATWQRGQGHSQDYKAPRGQQAWGDRYPPAPGVP